MCNASSGFSYLTTAPGPPKQIKMISIGEQQMVLSWSPPDYVGGSNLKGYIIEHKGVNDKTWIAANQQLEQDTNFTVHNLNWMVQYEFRVKAVNQAGAGQPIQLEGSMYFKQRFFFVLFCFVFFLTERSGLTFSTLIA